MKSIFLTCLLSIAGLTALFGQAGIETIHLSLDDAQNYALEHNRTLKNAALDIRLAEAERWKNITTLLPQVSASLDYQNFFDYKIDLGGMSIAMPSYGSFGLTSAIGVSAAQIIGIQLSNISAKMSDINQKLTEQDITSQVKIMYYSALVTEKTIDLLTANLENLRQLYNYSQKAVDVGAAEQIDADQLLVQVATMETGLNSAKRNHEMVLNSLRLQLCIPVTTEIVLTQSIEDLLNEEESNRLLSEVFVPEKNYTLQLMEESTLISKKQVRMAQWAYAPSIRIFHQYNTRKYFSDERTMNMTPPNLFGISLSVPIFSSGNRYSAVQSAKRSYEKQLNVLADTQDAMQIQHRQLCFNLVSAKENFATQAKNVTVTQRVFDNISKKYEYGHASSLDVTTSGTNLINAQSSYVQSLLEYVKATIELEKLLNL
ncbi:MAG: TolC family protein [Bacteroidales bacterium]|nr:TolC family protein [Bacteroidales bacterium]